MGVDIVIGSANKRQAKEAARFYKKHSGETLRMIDPNSSTIVTARAEFLKDDAGLVGMAIVGFGIPMTSVYYIFVEESHRMIGVGSKMLQYIEKEAIAINSKSVQAEFMMDDVSQVFGDFFRANKWKASRILPVGNSKLITFSKELQ